MRCPFCGNDVPDEFKFCSRCGNQLPAPMIVDPEPPKKKKTGLVIGLSIGGVILVAAIVLAILSYTGTIDLFNFLQKPPEIETVRVNLNNYLSASFSGYEGQGTAEVTFDEESFVKDFAGKIVVIEDFLEEAKIRKPKEEEEEEKAPDERGVKALLKEISFEASPLTDLKNSDTITVTWNIKPEELEEVYNIHLVSSDTVFTVEGLTLIAEIDPFDGVVITYEGVSPNVTASFTLAGVDESCKSIIFAPDKTTHLKNGDIITVTITNYDEEAMKAEFGKVLTTTTKQYTVEAPSSYVMDVSELSGLDLSVFDSYSHPFFTDYWSQIAITDLTENYFTNVGTYFLTNQSPLPESGEYNFNALFSIYEVHATYSYTPFVDTSYAGIYSAAPVNQEYHFYYATFVPDLIVTDGVVQIPYDKMDDYTRTVEFQMGYLSNGGGSKEELLAEITANNPGFKAVELTTGEIIEAVSADQTLICSQSQVDTPYIPVSPVPPAAAEISLPMLNSALPSAAHFSEGTTELTFHGYTFSHPASTVVYPAEAFTQAENDQLYYWDDYTVLLRETYLVYDIDSIATVHSLIRDSAIEALGAGKGEGISFDIYQYQEVVNPNNIPMEISHVKVIGDPNFPEQYFLFAFIYDDANKSVVVFSLSIVSPGDDTLDYTQDFCALLNSVRK